MRFGASRLCGTYSETAFEDVIEANRRWTWTINACQLNRSTNAFLKFTRRSLKSELSLGR